MEFGHAVLLLAILHAQQNDKRVVANLSHQSGFLTPAPSESPCGMSVLGACEV